MIGSRKSPLAPERATRNALRVGAKSRNGKYVGPRETAIGGLKAVASTHQIGNANSPSQSRQ